MTIDEYLEQQFITLEEVKETIRMQQMFEKLVEARAEISEGERDQYWEERSEEVKYADARENHLTEAEATELSREDVQDSLDEMIRREKESEVRQSLMDELINNIDLKILAIGDKAKAERYEDLLINLSKTEVEEEVAEQPVAETPATDGVATDSIGGAPAGEAEELEGESGEEMENEAPEEEAPAEAGGEGAEDGAETSAEPEAGAEEPEGESDTEGK